MKSLLIAALISLPAIAGAQSKIQTFDLSSVRLKPGIFQEAETTDLNYIMALDPDRLLSPYLREAGLTPKAPGYENWENTGLDGHVGGHYLSALALMYGSTGNQKVLDRLNYMLEELKRCQDKTGNGYIGGVPGGNNLWKQVAENKFTAGRFDISKKWVPLYNIHKAFAGLRDAYLFAKSSLAKDILIKYADWLVNVTSKLSDSDIQRLLISEHGGMNEVLADVSAITGNKKYLELAKKFSDKTIEEPLARREDKLTGLHANTQIPKIVGFERIAQLSGDQSYHTAASFFWETVVNKRTVAIGGHGVAEHFHPTDNFSTMISSEQGPETCNSYNMLKLSKALYESEGLEKYMDYYERTLYNHILSSQHPQKGGFVYFTPMRPGHYRVYSQPQTSFWCCVGSGLENHAKYTEMIYAHTKQDLYVNLFIPSNLNWKEKGLVVSQDTRFPDAETSVITVESVKKGDFNIQVRYPVWVAAEALKVSVNGEPVNYAARPGSYIVLKRKWKKGDKISVTLPMKTTTEQMPDGSNYFAVLRGPIVLAAKVDSSNLTGLFADSGRGSHIAQGKKYPLQEMPLLVSNQTDISENIKPVSNKALTFSASSLIYPEKYKSVELIPFFRLHDARYVIYWQKVTAEKLQGILQDIAAKEVEKQKLDGMTLDLVSPGEQQPESDHFIESQNSNTGSNNDRHWRDAKGFFSYRLKDSDQKADRLQITYWGQDRDRKFKILVNDRLLEEVILNGSKGAEFYTVDYSLPQDLVRSSKGVLTVKFEALPGSATAGIYEVRLLRK